MLAPNQNWVETSQIEAITKGIANLDSCTSILQLMIETIIQIEKLI